jgi:hypothetical protein
MPPGITKSISRGRGSQERVFLLKKISPALETLLKKMVGNDFLNSFPTLIARPSLVWLQVHVEKLRGRGPCLFTLFALEAVIRSGDDQQLDVPISFSKRFSHPQALLDWNLGVTVAVNKQDRSADLVCNMDWGVRTVGSAYKRDIEVTDSRVARRIPPTLNIGDREIRDDGFDSSAPSAGE